MTILSFPTTIDGVHTHRFVGVLIQQAIAYCELSLTNAQEHVATLYSVFVDPQHRGKGYASHLVSAAIADAQEHGKTVVNLRVHQSNTAAINLYNRLGFEQYRGPDQDEFLDLACWVENGRVAIPS